MSNYCLLSPRRILANAIVTLLISFVLFPHGTSFAGSISVDEASIRGPGQYTGILPTIIYALVLRDSTGAFDVLPPGPDKTSAWYLFGLFDTGSTSVAISNASAATLQTGTLPKLFDVRINGLGAIDSNLGAPIGPPEFAPSQGGVGSILVGTSTKDVDLIGAPVATRTVALIDNRIDKRVTRGPYPFDLDPNTPAMDQYITGPDITFFSPYSPPSLRCNWQDWSGNSPAPALWGFWMDQSGSHERRAVLFG